MKEIKRNIMLAESDMIEDRIAAAKFFSELRISTDKIGDCRQCTYFSKKNKNCEKLDSSSCDIFTNSLFSQNLKMTKEKADDLVYLFSEYATDGEDAKRCAMMAVDLILKSDYGISDQVQFWNNVKDEIKICCITDKHA